MNSINQQENSSKDEKLIGYKEESKLEQNDSNEEQKNETTSSFVRNNEKQLLSSILPANDVSNEYENVYFRRLNGYRQTFVILEFLS